MPTILEANHRAIWTSEIALDFCEKRAIALSSIRQFQLGVETRSISKLVGRLLFPIRSATGEFLGFQGRAFSNSTQPKYWHNSTFDKQRVLYGLYENQELIAELGFAVLLEGNIDVLTLWQCGIPAVAKQGPHFFEHQATMLRRLTDTIVSWPDSDKAGQQADEQQQELLDAFGFDVYKVKCKKYKDANEVYLAEGASKVRELIYG